MKTSLFAAAVGAAVLLMAAPASSRALSWRSKEIIHSSFLEGVLAALPSVVLVKDGDSKALQDDDTALRYLYFNPTMDALSGLSSHALIGRNSRSDFPEDFASYFEDDKQVLEGGCDTVTDIHEPWKVPKGSYEVHTRKTAMCDDASMMTHVLGVFHPLSPVMRGDLTKEERPIPVAEGVAPVSVPSHVTLGGPTWAGRVLEQLPIPVLVRHASGEWMYANAQTAKELNVQSAWLADAHASMLESDAMPRALEAYLDEMRQEAKCGLLQEWGSFASESGAVYAVQQRPVCVEGVVKHIIYVFWKRWGGGDFRDPGLGGKQVEKADVMSGAHAGWEAQHYDEDSVFLYNDDEGAMERGIASLTDYVSEGETAEWQQTAFYHNLDEEWEEETTTDDDYLVQEYS